MLLFIILMQDLIRQLKQDTIVQYPREVEAALGELPTKHRRFVVLTACGVNRLDAYRQAYNHTEETTDNVISASASRLIAIDSNKRALEAVTRWIESRTIGTDSTAASQYCYERWLELSRHEQPGIALRATELIARAAGMFVSRSEVRHIHALDTESTESLLRNILGDLGIGDTIDATFTAETQSNQSLTTPSLGDSSCPACGRAIK
jgi:hypothetical protein